MVRLDVVCFYGFVLATAVSLCDATLSRSDKKQKKSKSEPEVSVSPEAYSSNVFDRGLVSQTVKYKDVLREHSRYCEAEKDVKKFGGKTLVYVTPWNGLGYDIAKTFNAKFDLVSPVWLQVKKKGSKYIIMGTQDIDEGWAATVTSGSAQLIPRVLFDGWSYNEYHELFTSEQSTEHCVRVIVNALQKYNFAGATIEIWSQLGQHASGELIHLIEHMSDAFKAAGKLLVLVVPPALLPDGRPGQFVKSNFDALLGYVDYFSLMTYDYSNWQKPGPNSPLVWVKANVQTLEPSGSAQLRQKILLGLNFYGNEYYAGSGNTLVGKSYLDLLKIEKPKEFLWESKAGEHFFEYETGQGVRSVYYPSLQSIHMRLQLARELGTGISIWEIGQGLTYFYDLL